MRLNIDFSDIEDALASIGGKKATIETLRSIQKIQNPIELQIIEKGSVILSKEELSKQLSILAGLLSIGNTQITLHIYDPYEDEDSLRQIPATAPKFHFTECNTLKEMRKKGRFDRYVAAKRRDGLFQVRPYDSSTDSRGEKMEARLQPCHNCLVSLDYNGYADLTSWKDKTQAKKNFALEAFFKDFESIFRSLPTYTSETFPEGNYTEEWAKISLKTRSLACWICSCCKVNCEDFHDLLHVHHKDGNRGNNLSLNLEVVCLACHKARPFHNRMNYSPQNKKKLENRRISQKLPPECQKCNV